MVRYEDLEEETTKESVVLKIKDKNQFCQGIAVETTKVRTLACGILTLHVDLYFADQPLIYAEIR